MDIKKYIDLALSSLEKANYYSEIPKEQLENTLTNHIEYMYLKEMEIVSLQIDADRVGGKAWTSKQYDEAIDNVTNTVLNEVYEIALTNPNFSLKKLKKPV
ncbi:MAG TPA: hypothetical protein VI911_11400 [Patescibacteria group bacterium]|nr:hypothetical protein [Patescibacteria group bacterium]